MCADTWMDPNRVKLNEERIKFWLGNGAKPTDRVAKFLGNAEIIDNRNLSKTTDLAVIIKKLKNIRDNKINSNKTRSSKKINNEIKKLNETINLAEDLFTKELLDL